MFNHLNHYISSLGTAGINDRKTRMCGMILSTFDFEPKRLTYLKYNSHINKYKIPYFYTLKQPS